MAAGVVLALAVLTGAGGFAARQVASAAEPLAGTKLSAQDVRILVSAGSACVALTPARLAGQVMVASRFGSQPVAELRERGATGPAALTPEQWEQNVPWSGARPTDREAAITALARLTCRLVGQSRAVNIEEDPWRVALAAYRVGLDQVIAAGGIPGDAKDYVDTVQRYARWYALQPALGDGSAATAAPSGGGSLAPVPDAFVNAVVAAGRICPEMPPARVAAQIAVTSGFDPYRLGPAGEQGIAQFLPSVWAANVQASATRSPWNPSVAIPALGRTMCELVKQTGGQYPRALAAFARGDEKAAVGTLAETVTKAEAQYAKDTRLQAVTTPSASPKPNGTKATAKPTRRARDNQPAVKAADATGRSYGPYFIHNLVTDRCVDLPGLKEGRRDGPVNQFECNKTRDDNQEWTFEPRSVDGDGYQLYWIRNVDDGFCIDPPGLAAVEATTPLNETGCADRDNQYFRLEPKKTSGGFAYYWLRNTAANLCLDVAGVRTGGDGARLTLFPCRSNDDHEWALIEKSEW